VTFRRIDERSGSHEAIFRAIQGTLKSHEATFRSIDGKLERLTLAVENINAHLASTSRKFRPVSLGRSPLQLSPLGEAILKDTGGDRYIDDNLSALLSRIEEKKYKSPLDVQNYTYMLLVEKSRDDGFVPIKDFVFQNPRYRFNNKTIDLDLDIVWQVMSLYLRNRFFEERTDLRLN
jgi:hypothetical protein